MALTAAGIGGEVRVGGRVAAELGSWKFEGSSSGWIVEARIIERDEYLLDYEAMKELRLDLKTRTWRFRDIVITPGGEVAVITGSGRPDTL